MALNFLLFGIPPPISNMISRKDIPMGISISPVFVTLPTREKIFVPLLPAVPILLYHSAPRLIIIGILAHVSTLFRLVGRLYSPLSTVWMCFVLGSPLFPSKDCMRAVDSPQTKAPPPFVTLISNDSSEPRIFSPRNPHSCASLTAFMMFSTARGYSARTYT